MLDQEHIGNLIKTFHLAVTYLRIYPPTSQMVVAALETLTTMVQHLTAQGQAVTFSELSGKLLVNGTEPESREIQLIGNNILTLFTRRKIQSITLQPGIDRDELAAFITDVLAKRREDLGTSPHIALDQTVYVAMMKGEETVVKISDMVNSSGGDIVGLIKSVRESCDLIDQLPDPAQRLTAQGRLVQELAKQNPTALQEIFDRDLPPRLEQSGLKTQLLSALSQEKIKEIFGEIVTWYDAVRQKEHSDFAAVEQLEKLKRFMQTVLTAPAAKEIPRQFFEELLQKGLLEQLPEWFAVPAAKPATVFEIERLLEKDPAELLDKQVADTLPQLAEKLCQIENNELLGALLEKLLKNLANTAARIRLLAIQSIARMYEVLQAHNREQLLRLLELPLIEAMNAETSPDVYGITVELLRHRVRQNLLYGEYDFALRIVELLRRQSAPEIGADERIRTAAAAARTRLVPEVVEILVADLTSDNEKKRFGSLQVFERLENAAVDPLIRVIKESADVRSRKLAALALRNLGPAAQKRFEEELNLGLTAEEIRRVVEVLGDLGTEQTVEALRGLLRYPDPAAKKDIMRFLAKLNTGQATALLIEQLKDPDEEVAGDAVRLLGDLRCGEAVPALLRMLASRSASAALCEALCIALGTIGHAVAVPALVLQLRRRPFLFGAPRPERVRVRAAWALRRFSGPAVEKALEQASRDKAPAVALTARESLAALRGHGGKPHA
jgi:HEAT repeat protein